MNSLWKSAAKISLIYVAIGAIWILASDLALTLLLNTKEEVTQLQTVKGWFYIFTTGVFLFWLVHRQLKTIKESEDRWRFALEGSGDGVWD